LNDIALNNPFREITVQKICNNERTISHLPNRKETKIFYIKNPENITNDNLINLNRKEDLSATLCRTYSLISIYNNFFSNFYKIIYILLIQSMILRR